jgi:HlyD family secretion protein
MRIAGVEVEEAAKAPAGAASGQSKVAAPSTGKPTGAAGVGGGAGGAMAEFRNRLVTELKLTPEQVEKVDAIYGEARPQFMQMRDLPAEAKPRAREKIMAELRARIEGVLTAEQKPKYAAMQAEAASRTSTRGRIYVTSADGKPKALNVRLGVSDGSMTELLLGPNAAAELKEGTEVIVGTKSALTGAAPKPPGAGPRAPF